MQTTDALLALPVGLNNPMEQGQAQAIGHTPAMFGTWHVLSICASVLRYFGPSVLHPSVLRFSCTRPDGVTNRIDLAIRYDREAGRGYECDLIYYLTNSSLG